MKYTRLFAGILFLFPLFLAWWWGDFLPDKSYVALSYARQIGQGQGLWSLPNLVWLSPLWYLFLMGVGGLGLSLPVVALFAGSLGWSILASGLYHLLVPHLKTIEAFLLVGVVLISPLLIWTMGMVWGWVAVGLLVALYIGHHSFARWHLLVYLILLLLFPSLLVWLLIVWLTKNIPFPSGKPQRINVYGLAGLVLLFVWEGQWIWQQFQYRPHTYIQIENEMGTWLQAHSQVGDTLVGTGRLGYLADLPIVLAEGALVEQERLPATLQQLQQTPPTFVISISTLPWLHLTQSGWFQTHYQLAQTFSHPAEGLSPVQLWQYQDTPLSQMSWQPAQVMADNGLELIGYRYAPSVAQPDEPITVELHWRTHRPLTGTIHSVVRMQSPRDSVGWAQQDVVMPLSLPPHWLQVGDTFQESFVLTPTIDIPLGSYDLNISLYEGQTPNDFLVLRQPDDPNPLDRVVLGSIGVPAQGGLPAMTPVSVTFGEQIELLGYTLTGQAEAGSLLQLILYWQALVVPDDNYTVFVHLLDENNQSVTNHDSMPLLGAYPTNTWQPDYWLPDEHPLFLPAELNAGIYTIYVGFYKLETGVRLSVRDNAGNPQTGDTLLLHTIMIR